MMDVMHVMQQCVLDLPHAAHLGMRHRGVQALDGFSLCLWQLGEGEADTALAGTNVFPLLHRLSKESDQLLRRSVVTAVGALSHSGQLVMPVPVIRPGLMFGHRIQAPLLELGISINLYLLLQYATCGFFCGFFF